MIFSSPARCPLVILTAIWIKDSVSNAALTAGKFEGCLVPSFAITVIALRFARLGHGH